MISNIFVEFMNQLINESPRNPDFYIYLDWCDKKKKKIGFGKYGFSI